MSTDRNGDQLAGDILDIIDKHRSRYAVAVAVAAYIRDNFEPKREDDHEQ
jgi:hypothetical protein